MKNLVDRLHERFALSSLGVTETMKDIKKWQGFLSKFPETEDCYEQAFYKYKCRMYYFSLPKRIFMNVLGMGAFLVEMLYIAASDRKLKKPKKSVMVLEKARDIPDFDDIVPKQVFSEFSSVEIIENHNEKFGFLCAEAKKYYWENVKRHPFSFFFNYFVYMELATHSAILLKQNPEVTLVYINERNVASPILTDFYHSQGRKLFSFMHGEYTLQLQCALMRFSRYYVWDETYVKMFKEDLRCHIDEYKIYTPKKLEKKWDLSGVTPGYYITYYFSGEDEETTKKVVDCLDHLTDCGLNCKIRPHPRNKLHIKLLKELLNGKKTVLEDPAAISLRDSIADTEFVAGLQSTVLSEAYIEGKQIAIDDVGNPERYETLKFQKFNILTKPHRLLSDLMKTAGQ